MSREKQIEEIANILWHIPGSCFLNSYDDCTRIAECIYDDGGYRKQSEVVKERASNDCWKTCPDSRYNKIKTETEKILNQKIKNQREEIKRLRKCLFDVNNSRDYWKAKACRVGKQLQQTLEDMRNVDEKK